MSAVNATAPEWLQADLLILSLLIYFYARTLPAKGKAVLYCFGSALFAVAYLTKYNSALFGVTLIGLLLLDTDSWRFKALQSLASVAIFLAVTSAYAGLYHQRSTGTTHLSFDHAWVMIEALPPQYLSQPPENLGINTLRWIALSSITPPEYFRAMAITNVNYGAPLDVQRPYNEQLQTILRMSKSELVEFVKAHPLPAYYKPGSAAVPLYYYYGLEPMDALGIQVYKESVGSEWGEYVRRIGLSNWSLFLHQPSFQEVPTFAEPLDYRFGPPDFTVQMFGRSRLLRPSRVADPYRLPYYNPSEAVLFYGVKVVDWVRAIASIPFLYPIINIVALVGLLRLRLRFEKVIAICVLTGVLVFISGSAMLLGMRAKEIITITPVYFFLVSLSCAKGLTNRVGEGKFLA
jgi:hypothetical protein